MAASYMHCKATSSSLEEGNICLLSLGKESNSKMELLDSAIALGLPQKKSLCVRLQSPPWALPVSPSSTLPPYPLPTLFSPPPTPEHHLQAFLHSPHHCPAVWATIEGRSASYSQTLAQGWLMLGHLYRWVSANFADVPDRRPIQRAQDWAH